MNGKEIKNKQKLPLDNHPKGKPLHTVSNDSVRKAEADSKKVQKTKEEENVAVTSDNDVLREAGKLEQELQGKIDEKDVGPTGEIGIPEKVKKVDENQKAVPAEEADATNDNRKESVVDAEIPKESSEKSEHAAIPEEQKKKKDNRPSDIVLKDKSEAFKKIIDVALAYEKIENERKKLKQKVKVQDEQIKELTGERDSLKSNLEATELLCLKKQEDIDSLQADIEHRNQVIDIVKADKNESAQEFKNALAAALRLYKQDFQELKTMDMNNELGYAIVETLERVFKVLDKNGIKI